MGTSNWKDRDRSKRKKDSQNDIKKLRRENEQLRREIWSLRDEYDKLEEILKKQRSGREESGEPEDRSGDEAAGSSCSEDEDDDDDDGQDEESESEEDPEERNAEDEAKSSPEKTGSSPQRGAARVNFDNLPVVSEEEELRRENKENRPENHQHTVPVSASSFPFAFEPLAHGTTTAPANFAYQADCPFIFPALGSPGSYVLMTPQPQKPEAHLGFDVVSQQAPPPPAGWQGTLDGLSFAATQSPKLTTQAVVENDRKLADRRQTFFTFGNGDATSAVDEGAVETRAKHFFAPLRPLAGEEADSPGSEKTGSTVVARAAYEGSADVCVNGTIPLAIDQGDAKAFFGTEDLIALDVVKGGSSSSGSSNPLTKSVSCQDLSSRLSFAEKISHAKSDSTLDNLSVGSKPFKSQLNVVLRQPGSFRKSTSSDVPEIPQLPSIDYKLFSNPFLQNFEQAYQNFPLRTEGQSPVTHPLSIQVCESPVSGASYSSPVRVQPSFSGSCPPEADCTSCRRKDERLRLTIPGKDGQEFQVTSFESPSPHTLQMPPMTPYELDALRRMPTGTSPVPRLYQNVPFVPRGAPVYCPGQGVRVFYDAAATAAATSAKVPAQTQTSPEDNAGQQPKRRSRKEKGSVREKRASQRRSKEAPKKQASVTKDSTPARDESRSSSTGRESSPKKGGTDQTKRVSLHFSAKKRPSISSVRTSRSRSAERERTSSVSSREQQQQQQPPPQPAVFAGGKNKARRNSTSSGSVPWCACWGNGCF